MSQEGTTPTNTLLSLELAGLAEFEPRRLEALIEALHAALRHRGAAPAGLCHGARLLARRVAWECLGGLWTLVETDTFLCPNGAFQDVRVIVQRTHDPCDQLL
ncbi:MAG: hypothetical protein ACREKH_21870 [Candidatus Rokuibacteriota bacterium]